MALFLKKRNGVRNFVRRLFLHSTGLTRWCREFPEFDDLTLKRRLEFVLFFDLPVLHQKTEESMYLKIRKFIRTELVFDLLNHIYTPLPLPIDKFENLPVSPMTPHEPITVSGDEPKVSQDKQDSHYTNGKHLHD